jgi:hypothetical protein
MKSALAVLCLGLSACAGAASYSVKPFYSPELGKMVCCEAAVSSSRDIASVTVDAVKTGDDYQIHFSESGVSATAPIQANTAAVSAIAGAVTATANAAAKFSLKP